MKMLYLSLTLMIALLGATAYLALQARDEAVKANIKMDLLTQQQRAVAATQPVAVQMPPAETVAPAPVAAPVVVEASAPKAAASLPAGSTSAPPSAPDVAPATAPAGSPAMSAAPAPAADLPLTPAQRRVKAAPSIAKVKEYVPDQGFVVLSAGKKQGLIEGSKFDLRRDASVVGRIKITGVDEVESIGNVEPRSIPSGVTVQAGDEVIGVTLQN